jgi:HlyD family secretion protein
MTKKIVLAAIGVVVVVVAVFVLRKGDGGARQHYQFVKVEKGDIENTISSTGTLSAVGTVEVGTQVSGTMSKVLVDYNDHVEKGRVLAVLDTTLLSATVRDARGGILRADAQHNQALQDYQRSKGLREQNLISESEFTVAETSFETAKASLLSAQAALDRSRANLKYAVIRSPIEGTVIKRNVEPGQTVAASFSTPTLFIIAEDLSKMEILALVDESDIGMVKLGMPVRFTVEAQPDRTFTGTVREIRLQPETVQNVVNYTVVVEAPNPDGLLLPGMTATTDFVVEQKKGVLLVPGAALRFEASDAMMTEAQQNVQKRFESLPDAEKEKIKERMANRAGQASVAGGAGAAGGPPGGPPPGGPPGGGVGGGSPGGGNGGGATRLWYLDENGKLLFSRVVTGATDGKMTEIVRGEGIREGMDVITGLTAEGEKAERDAGSAARALRGGRF